MICLESLILRTCERKALLEHDSCVRILEMHAEAMHGSICAAGTKYYLPVRRSCSWSGQRLQCMWTHVVQITNPIRKRIAIRNGFRNVISSFVNRPNDSWSSSSLLSMIISFLSFDYLSTYCCVYYVSITEALIIPISKKDFKKKKNQFSFFFFQISMDCWNQFLQGICMCVCVCVCVCVCCCCCCLVISLEHLSTHCCVYSWMCNTSSMKLINSLLNIWQGAKFNIFDYFSITM